jgi:uncharacterized protein YndB with AHSA1/START domain
MNVEFRRETVIATSPKNVWRALTNPYDLMNWASEHGESTQDKYVLQGSTVFGGQMGGDVLERQEEHILRFRWMLGGRATEVTIVVEPEAQQYGNFTKVTVEHQNIPDDFRPSQQSEYPEESFSTSWILWLRHLSLWAERAVVTGKFNYMDPLSTIIEKSVIIEADVRTVWRYITESDLRNKLFGEPLGAETNRIERNHVTYQWVQDTPSTVTFHVEPMSDERTLVLVHHEGLSPNVLYDYHIGWQDYLVSLVQTASVPLIRQTVWIDASPQRVWSWFLSQEAMQKWWNPSTTYEPRVGGRISFSDHGSFLHGMVTELTPCTRFAFTFVESGTEGTREPYVVSLDLEPEQNGTRVYITQSGFDKLPEEIRDRVFVAYQWGWADSPELDRLATACADKESHVL